MSLSGIHLFLHSFFIIAFASYVEGTEDFSQSFSEWLGVRIVCLHNIKDHLPAPRIEPKYPRMLMLVLALLILTLNRQIAFLRKAHGSKLNVFAPAHDLSLLSKTEFEGRSLVPGKKNDMAIAGSQISGDEYSNHVVKVPKLASDGIFSLL